MPVQKPAVFLIDTSIYIFRAWFTWPDSLVTRNNEPANAVYGFADFLLALLENERPSHIACAFDKSLTTSYRNEIYPLYKANRDPAPPELEQQFSFCRELVNAAGIAAFASERYEADDIIGTLSFHMRNQGFCNFIISGDKDLAQLIDEHDYWWEYAKNKRMDRKSIFAHFGVYPEQIADLLALAGDAVDNIPGIPGIGLKTAARLLNKFGTLDAVIENMEKIGDMKFRGAKRVQTLIQEHQEMALLSRELTLIQHDQQLPEEESALAHSGYLADELEALFDHLDFNQQRRQRWHNALSR